MICAHCRQPEGVVNRIAGDGLCEDCRLILAQAQVASKRCCVSCLEPEETAEGTIVLDGNGLCEDCQDAQEWGEAIAQEDWRSMDFNYSMNY